MGSLVSAGVCCCFSCCCQQCADGCSKWLGPEKVTKIYYFLLVLVFVVPAIFVFFFLNRWKSFLTYFLPYWVSCPNSTQGLDFSCVGSSAVFRLSLALLCLFGIMMLFMLFRSRLSMALNEGCFCFKYILVFGAFVGFLWVNNQVFETFGQASKYISIFYMIMQSIILIDLFYLAGIKLVKNYDAGQSHYACILVFLALLFEATAIMMNVLGYVFFHDSPEGCSSSLWVNIVTSILMVLMIIIQLLHFNPQNSLVTTALVSMFISYLCFIAQYSYDGGSSETCNRMGVGPLIADIVCSLFFFVLTMYGSVMGGTGQVKVTRDGNVNNAIGVGATEHSDGQNEQKYSVPKNASNGEISDSEESNLEKYTNSWQWVKWHFYMCLASVYVAMLITNWTSANIVSGQFDRLQPTGFGFWVRVAIAWATFLLYVWTMIAPRVCPSRDFTVQ